MHHLRARAIVAALLGALLTSGCGGGGDLPSTTFTVSTPDEKEDLSRYQVRSGGLAREFYYYHPANPTHEKLPLVVFFHGAGAYASEAATGDQPWIPIAQREKFYFVEPQALSDSFESFTYWDVGWNRRDDVAFIRSVIDQLVAQQNIDTDRIYLTGVSSGGFMTFYATLKLQDSIAAVAPIEGSVLTTVMPGYSLKKPMPMCKIHGDADTVVSMKGGDYYVPWVAIRNAWFAGNGIPQDQVPVSTDLPDIDTHDGSTITLLQYRGATKASDVDDYLVHHGYHATPGIDPYANQDMNSYEVIWSFLKQHKLSDRL